jgi:hypothetical protein
MITFVTTAYKETIDAHVFLASLILQNDPRWECIIVCDEDNQYIKNTVKFFNDDRIKFLYIENEIKYYGHTNRKYALDNLVTTDFILQTSIQDYFLPCAVGDLLSYAPNYDFIYYNSLHNHFGYKILNSQLEICKIDWGNFVIRTKIAKEVGINKPESNACDGFFVEDCIKYPNLRILKLDKILTVHN